MSKTKSYVVLVYLPSKPEIMGSLRNILVLRRVRVWHNLVSN